MTRVAAHAVSSRLPHERLLPFIIIVFVGLATVGGALIYYRAKMQPLAAAVPHRSRVRRHPGQTVTGRAGGLKPNGSPARRVRRINPSYPRPAHAPVTLEIYGDFQCPSCALTAALFKELREQYGDKLREIFYEFPLAMHNHSVEAARAAEAAGIQGKFWRCMTCFTSISRSGAKRPLSASSSRITPNPSGSMSPGSGRTIRLRMCSNGRFAGGGGGGARVQNTPTIFLNGTLVRANFTKEKLVEQIDQALAAKGKP
jgi:hypothetical protein